MNAILAIDLGTSSTRARLYDALHLPSDAPLSDVMATRTCADWIAFARQHDLPLSIVR